jgi:DNA (cytosine-5)-methyltransferase 1
MNALDLFCGAGGVTLGLKQAGFHVTGVDILPQPRYCGDVLVLMDAVEYLETADLTRFDFISASPPCQRYTSLRHAPGEHRDADLIGITRVALIKTGKPWVIENVEGAPLVTPVTLCGSMFGLATDPYPDGWQLERHRLFEASFPLAAPGPCRHDERPVVGVYGGHVRDRRRPIGTDHKPNSNVPTKLGYRAMGVLFGSMTVAEISDAIPPAYARYVAEAWLRSVRNALPEAFSGSRTAVAALGQGMDP